MFYTYKQRKFLTKPWKKIFKPTLSKIAVPIFVLFNGNPVKFRGYVGDKYFAIESKDAPKPGTKYPVQIALLFEDVVIHTVGTVVEVKKDKGGYLVYCSYNNSSYISGEKQVGRFTAKYMYPLNLVDISKLISRWIRDFSNPKAGQA